jgi:hypothetical protein
VPETEFPGEAVWLDWPCKLRRIENHKSNEITWELYNLASDSYEHSLLLAEQPERVPEMQKASQIGLPVWLGVLKARIMHEKKRF